jgi:general secretion pathway protein E
VSTLPTEGLESVVMRVLDSRKGLKSFTELGFDQFTVDLITRALKRKSGMLLVTGPTGSGKTTTLYAMLKELNSSEKKLVSLEDPVEYHLEGVTQSPVDENSDYSFSNGLKALLRHDPDVILIGEIREATTAKLASEAALTGHVVLSSLHTNSALGAISRLRNLGLESFNIASAINAVFAQRLVRKVCSHCVKKSWVDLSDHKRVSVLLKTLEAKYPNLKTSGKTKGQHEGQTGIFLEVPEPSGCEKCSHTGYSGQTAICEALWFTDQLRDAIAKEMGEQGLKELATVQNDSTSLFGDGLKKVILGETTLDEVYRVAG